MSSVDLNADLGEGFGRWTLGDDDALLGIVTSANVACGFHAGDPSTMYRTCGAAVERSVAIGAQVGYRDLAGFGRRRIDYDLGELRDDLLYQIGALEAFCRVAGGRVGYVKPHGALYNTAAVEEGQAGAIVAAVRAYDAALPVLCQPGSVLARVAIEAGVTVVGEGFADRGYRADGTLMPRSLPGAVLHDPDEVVARAVRMAVEQVVETADGELVPTPVASICVHGDTPGAVGLASRVRAELAGTGLTVESFSRP
ncbi:LamB/YcsF family protein [Paractinoplanes hotanensis]|uniref:5-oxoprolinase subunit A n=1 Tax=Paractinoplanes hotanensis TaxID=2906497 RepID=A0ABT0Y6T4_9ACTN|nr:5-oxoprolinase subunit PxpA [Actinoplanes hotanensis]MCM4081731.1 LamB/YcsF family protein [Actinoplanes hotanensis]